MLVVEDRHSAAALFENPRRALKEFVPGIARLTSFVSRIEAVLADDQHAIHGQVGAPKRESLFSGWIDLYVVPARPFPAKIVFVELVDVEPRQFQRRTI